MLHEERTDKDPSDLKGPITEKEKWMQIVQKIIQNPRTIPLAAKSGLTLGGTALALTLGSHAAAASVIQSAQYMQPLYLGHVSTKAIFWCLGCS
jgi:hypothetical protein